MIPTDGTLWLPGPIRHMRPSGIGSRSCPGARSVGDPDARSVSWGGAGEIVNDHKNLKGRPCENRRQTSVRRHLEGSPVGQNNKIVMFERGRQAGVDGFVVVDQILPEALWLCRNREFGKVPLERNRLLARNGKEAGHECFAARDRKGRQMDLRYR